ncbi:MAG: TolC family protein [Gemmatimonadota bacterium]|nr:TolC family protein [Gemmatimonadota bacterium]
MRNGKAWLWRGGVAVAVMVGLGGGVDAVAQERGGGDEVTVLTLQDALMRASQFNSQYRQALNQIELGKHPRQRWWANLMPNLGLSYSTGLGLRRQPYYVDFEGRPTEVADVRTVRSSNYSQGANVNLTLDPGQRYYQFRRTQAQARQSRTSAEQRLNSTLATVQRLYLDAQNSQAQLQVEEALLADRQLDLAEKESRFELLRASRSDLLSAELDLENQRIRVRTAQGAVDKALLALRTAIGDPELGALEIEREPPAPFDPSTLDLAELVARAGRESPSVIAAESDLAVQRAALNSAKALNWPSVTVNTTVSSAAYGEEYTELFGAKFDNVEINGRASLSVIVPLTNILPIFDGFAKSYDVASATMSYRNAEMSYQQTMLQVEESVRSKYLDLETAWENVLQRERAREVASDRLAIVREEYLLATKGIEELRGAIREEADARRQEVDQRFTFATALLALYEELGIVAREAGIDLPTEGN